MRKRTQLEFKSLPKYKYSFNEKTYDLNLNTSLDKRIGATRMPQSDLVPEKIKSSGSFTFDNIKKANKHEAYSTSKIYDRKRQPQDFKLPGIRKSSLFNSTKNPEESTQLTKIPYLKVQPNNNSKPQKKIYYQSLIRKSNTLRDNNYLISLAKQHFLQTIQALRIGKQIKAPAPNKEIKLSKKNPNHKTIYLDLDETLIHTDEGSTNYTVKLDFPIEGGETIAAGIRVRPHCNQFLEELSAIAEIIIFTASSQSYADVVLNYLDPHKKYFSHRLYRNHCTLQKGFYAKDLRVVNRRLEDAVLVDNSAYCYMLQPFNGVPILPYYHYGKDTELMKLLPFLKELLKQDDMRVKVKEVFFWHKYFQNDIDPRKIFEVNFQT